MKRTNSAPGGRLPYLPVPREEVPNQSPLSELPWDFIESLAEERGSQNTTTSGLIIPEPITVLQQARSVEKERRRVSDSEAAHEFFAAALRAAQLWAEMESSGKSVASH